MTDPYSNTYNPEWQNYPNLQWGGNNQLAPWAPPVDSPYAPLEDMMRQLNQTQQEIRANQKQLNQMIQETAHTLEESTKYTNEWLKRDIVNRDIERQIG